MGRPDTVSLQDGGNNNDVCSNTHPSALAPTNEMGWTPVAQATPPTAEHAQSDDSDRTIIVRFHGSIPALIQNMLPHAPPPLPGRTLLFSSTSEEQWS